MDSSGPLNSNLRVVVRGVLRRVDRKEISFNKTLFPRFTIVGKRRL